MRRFVCGCGVFALIALTAAPLRAQQPAAAHNDLDEFMSQVLTKRDDNWKKIQQYILDEQERVELRGASEALIFGDKREYVWYLRDGYFVRSPVRANGVAVSDADREKYEQNFLKRARERDKRALEKATDAGAPTTAGDMQNFIQQVREPQFVSSAYFMEFKFEAGKYALVGREKIDDRDVLRIEYYPTKLFSDEPGTRAEARANQASGRKSKEDAFGDEVQRLMNKVSLVTLWVEPRQKQIVKYTFDNIGLDFLPAAWLVRVTDLKATMVMSEAFPDVWLPKRIDMRGSVLFAPGPLTATYDIQYSGYREAATSTKYGGVKGR